ncbi:hypothetical protein ONR75_25145 [Rhodopseudomonas sp. P2A-2r]|uniref:hypothetical protein n=1 Tax=Rhodopseudomonas sp. P2A-2r TaxID=2991972 RepID=UPI0022342274|nr:hypothetical protein [Rhodopseudomonas sp. P2A-2r]UZE48099.1 hypothetical protein ONR75_25145 [Rhodopseudomonas sp. P2A-2r]
MRRTSPNAVSSSVINCVTSLTDSSNAKTTSAPEIRISGLFQLIICKFEASWNLKKNRFATPAATATTTVNIAISAELISVTNFIRQSQLELVQKFSIIEFDETPPRTAFLVDRGAAHPASFAGDPPAHFCYYADCCDIDFTLSSKELVSLSIEAQR